MPSGFVLDANVLYSARLRDLWLQIGAAGVARIFWTDTIEAEWTGALAHNRPDLQDFVSRTADLIRERFPEAYVPRDALPPLALTLPDAEDVHVVRAALAAGGAIVTYNTADFPTDAVAPLGVEILTPDEALAGLAEIDEEGLLAAAAAIRARLKAPPIDAETYAAGFEKAGCPAISTWLKTRLSRI